MTDRVVREVVRRRGFIRVVLAVLLSTLGFGSLLYFGDSVTARAQTVSGVTGGVATRTATPFPTHVITPPPSPCAPQPAGSCPVCDDSVPGASDYENSLPVPSPAPGDHYVVQLVNESNVTILAGADAAHQGSLTPGGPVPPPNPVLPREGTWLMQPKGAPNNGNILTIDIPQGWEATVCPQTNTNCMALGPRFWPRTGCKYDIDNNLAQCETGGCGDAYDCSRQALRDPPQASTAPPPTTIVEWTLNSQQQMGYAFPDISLVDGVTLTADVQALGLHCTSAPGQPTNKFWLSQRQPLAVHGADLRDAGRCISGFQLTRGEVGQIIQGEGNPDDVVACFTNCGRYEYPNNPGAGCDPSDESCKNWLAFCCYTPIGDPHHVYGGDCNIDRPECAQGGGCWNNGSQPCTQTPDCPSGFSCLDGVCAKPFCACRAFLKNPPCSDDVCTHGYSPSDRASQPPAGNCTDVTQDPNACIGDDTVHAVFPGGYTWPNDPQTYVSDARAYRIIFAPGYDPSVNPPITNSGPVPACDALPEAYGYDSQAKNCAGVTGKLFAGALPAPTCTTNEDCQYQPGITPPKRFNCDPATKHCDTWSCEIAPGGPVSTGTLLCRWPSTTNPSPTPTSTTSVGGPPPTSTRARGTDDDGCAITGNASDSQGGILLVLVAVAFALLRRRRHTRQ